MYVVGLHGVKWNPVAGGDFKSRHWTLLFATTRAEPGILFKLLQLSFPWKITMFCDTLRTSYHWTIPSNRLQSFSAVCFRTANTGNKALINLQIVNFRRIERERGPTESTCRRNSHDSLWILEIFFCNNNRNSQVSIKIWAASVCKGQCHLS